MSKGQVYLLDSTSGAVFKVNAPLLLEGLERPAEYQQIQKELATADPKSRGSKKLRDRYGITLDGAMCAARPFDFHLYAYAATLNTYHARCVRAKVKDIVGRDWKIAGEGPAKTEIETFFKRAFGKLMFGEGMGQVWTDYEALGNGYLEIVPTLKGDKPAELGHIPATEMWIRLDGLGFVQQKNGEYAHFRDWATPAAAFDALPDRDPLRGEGVTSICHFSRYLSWSPYYGIPSIMPAWNALALSVLQAEFNLGFFNNNAIPDYAVILDGEWGEGTEDTIRQYFRQHLKGQAHKTLVLQLPTGSKITFEKLTSDNAKEGSFRLLRVDTRDEILHAHGVPPQKVGIVETGRLGGNAAGEQVEEYKISIVEPGREKVCARLNRLIEEGFRTAGLTFEYGPYSTDDAKQNADLDAVYLDRKVVTPNEVRKVRYPTLPPLPGGDEPLESNVGAGAEALAQMQKEIRAAAERGE